MTYQAPSIVCLGPVAMVVRGAAGHPADADCETLIQE